MSIGVSGSSESGHKKDLGIPVPREKRGILAGALAGANIVIFDQTSSSSSSPITESSKSISVTPSGGGRRALLKGIATRKASSTGRPRKARGKSTKKASKSKKSGNIEDIEDTSADEDEIHETEEKGISAILEIDDFKKEDQSQEKRQELFDRLEKMARQGPITDLQVIIDTAWGKKGVYEDVTEAYDGLRAAQQYFGENEQELLQNLSHSTRAAGDIVYRENAPDIRAGYLFGPGTEATLSYREHVLRFEKVSDTFQAIMNKAEGDSRLFSKEIDKLIKGIQIDIKAQESTLDPSHLRQIMQGLFTVQMCSQLEKECGLLLRDMQSFYRTNHNSQPQIDNE